MFNSKFIEIDKSEYERLKTNILENEKTHINNIYAATQNDVKKIVMSEVVFCLMTPQSTAKAAFKAITSCNYQYELMTPEHLKKCGVRFHNNKSRYIQEFINNPNNAINAALSFWHCPSLSEGPVLRNRLEQSVRGLGIKEASHVVRNLGINENIAIIDRHILKCMSERNLIPTYEITLSKKKYLNIEQIFVDYAKECGILAGHLDMMWWASRSGILLK